jgi:hypothetical protein
MTGENVKSGVEALAKIAAGKLQRGVSPAIAEALLAELKRLRAIEREVNTPHTAEFLKAVQLEAAHQRERWAAEHDAGKTDADWFWLVGYLTGKALHKPEKQLHHIITTAAALLNWHAAKTGNDTRMRPGIAEPSL